MPSITVGKENSGNIDLYYEDHGTGKPDSAHRRFGTPDRQVDQGSPPVGGKGWAALHNLDPRRAGERWTAGVSWE